jgi:hypothetical protein
VASAPTKRNAARPPGRWMGSGLAGLGMSTGTAVDENKIVAPFGEPARAGLFDLCLAFRAVPVQLE